MGLDEGEAVCAFDDLADVEAARGEQRGVLSLIAIGAAGDHQPLDVVEFGAVRVVADRDDGLGHQERGVSGHGPAHDLQYLDDLLVGEVVQAALDQQGVTAGHGREEVAGDELDAITEVGGRSGCARLLDDVGLVEQHTTNARVRGEDGGEQRAGTATDVDAGMSGPSSRTGQIAGFAVAAGTAVIGRASDDEPAISPVRAGAGRAQGGGIRPDREEPPMRLAVKLLLAWFAFFGLAAGGWQQVAPRSFYDDFPGWGRHWVSPDGPYNEHLLRDVGQGNLAFGIVALVALLSGSVWLARATGLAAVFANVPHQAYHQHNLEVLPSMSDQVLQTTTLTAVTIAAIALAVLAFALRPETVAPAQRELTESAR